jgi:hypothetical protein
MKVNSLADFRRPLTIVLAIILAPIALCYTLIYFILIAPADSLRHSIQQSLNLYPSATFVLEDQGYFGADTAIKGLYYWTSAPINDVQKYYEAFLQPFLKSNDEYGNWLISAYYLDDIYLNVDTDSAFLGHGSFCSDFNDRGCITVALVDATQLDIYRLAVSSPSMFYRLTPPPEFANLPYQGTLIIYQYWVDDF